MKRLVVLPALALGLVAGSAAAQADDDPEPGDRGEGAVPRGGAGAVARPPSKPDKPQGAQPQIVMPELLKFEQAPYPAEAQKQGLEGDVILGLTIDAEGNVTEAEVIEPAGHGFDEAARQAALKFRFKPATRDGKPLPVRIKYRYSFTLTPAEPPPEQKPPEAPKTGNLGGKLRVADADAPLAGAEVVVSLPDGSERRVRADAQGQWLIEDVPPGTYQIRILAPGYETVQATEEVVAGQQTDITFRVEPELPAGEEGAIEVTVRGERPPREVTRRTIERREIERIPGTSGDALRSVQSLPGVARPPGLAGLLIVRGSSPQDTATFVDGADVPLIYHFGGLSSVVPTELLERIDFYPGNFSAKYGRVMGGIVDVGLRSPDTVCTGPYGKKLDVEKKGCYHGMAQVDLIDGRLLLQGPMGPIDDWSFAVAGRRSWIDVWLKPVLEEAGAGVTTAPVYYDYQIIAETEPTDDSKVSLRFFGSDDRLELLINDPAAQDPALGGNITFGTGFYRGQALYSGKISRDVELQTMVAVGKTSLDFEVGNFFFNLDTYPVNYRSEFGVNVEKGIKINAGFDFLVAPFVTTIRAPQPPAPGEPDPGPFATRPPLETRVEGTVFRPGWYTELELQPVRRLRIVPGARVDYARDSGQTDLSPRVNARYDLIAPDPDLDAGKWQPRTTIKGGVGIYKQPPEFQETDELFGTPGLDSNQAVHYSLGAEQEFTRQVELSVEGFYKDMSDLVVREPSLSGGFGYTNDGTGYVVGLETLLKYKPDKRFFGWIAYTLSRSVRQDGPNEEERLFTWDQTHNLIILGSYRLGRGWEFGARFRVVSGSLDTPVVRPPSLTALYAADAGTYVPIEGEPYSERLPLFHQLDVRIDKRWQFESWRLSAYLDVQNAYNNAAVEGVVYNYNYSQKAYSTGVPILPSIGIRGEF